MIMAANTHVCVHLENVRKHPMESEDIITNWIIDVKDKTIKLRKSYYEN